MIVRQRQALPHYEGLVCKIIGRGNRRQLDFVKNES